MCNSAHPMQSTLLTTAQAAERLGKSIATVNRLAAKGDLRPALELPGEKGARLFDPAELDRYLAARPRRATSVPDEAAS